MNLLDLGLDNKVALVLASSKGLGLACAKGFFKEGANVVICSRSEEHLISAKNEIENTPSLSKNNEVFYVVCDLKDSDAIKALIDKTMEKFERIDILVHNAGGPPSGHLMDISKEDWDNSIQLNLRSFIRACYMVVPIMKKQGGGRIISIASVSAKHPLENLVLSNTTRLGVVGFAKTLANEHAKDRILVNVVCPGPTLTDRMKELIESEAQQSDKSEEEVKKKWTEQIPMGRLGKPEEFANMVIFLASERASYVTGTVIQVDGGFVKAPF